MEEKHYLYRELYQRLQTDESLFAWFEQGATDGIWYWDITNPEHEWLSPRFKSLFGYGQDEMPHSPDWWQANIFPEDLPKVLDNFEKHKADPSHPYDQVVRYRHKTGKTVWVRCRGIIIRDEHGEPLRMLGAHTDVTDLMESRAREAETSASLQRTLNELSEINRLALATSDIGVWRWDLSDNRLYWDVSMYALYQIEQTDEPLVYHQWLERLHPDDAPEAQRRVAAALAGEPYRTSFRIILPDDSIRHLKAAAEVYFDSAGNPVRMRGANWDITEEKQREEDLARSNRDLSTFAYVASHDLKAPLRGIRQLANWIEEDLNSPEADLNEHLRLMKGRISRLETLLDDLLKYSRVSRPNEQRRAEEINTGELIRDIYEVLYPPQGMRLELVGDFPTLTTEKSLLEQLLINLIGNTIKHREGRNSGIIRVAVRAEGKFYRFSVADQNNTIEPRYHERIFDMFQTLKPRDEVEGSGMGLAISRRIIESKGGMIGLAPTPADSSEGFNNEFYFTWPKK